MGHETSKARPRRLREGTFDRYLTGRGIDIGCGDDPITPDCLRWDRPQGDAATLPGLEAESFDWVYSSHCLEDLPDPDAALRCWWEILKPGGCLVTCSCSYHVHEDDFEAILASAAADARSTVTVVEKRRQARDHPVVLGVPETYYLKCLVLRRLE